MSDTQAILDRASKVLIANYQRQPYRYLPSLPHDGLRCYQPQSTPDAEMFIA